MKALVRWQVSCALFLFIGGCDKKVEFADAHLELAVREAIAKADGPIWKSDLKSLKKLDARQKDIADLSGIEQCTKVQELILHGNRITDARPVGALRRLRALRLDFNEIKDVTPVSRLGRLQGLDLAANRISDVSPLRDLRKLQWLFLSHNRRIRDISPLSRLTRLRDLQLEWNQISDIRPIRDMTDLQRLEMRANEISDIGPVSKMRDLRILCLDRNRIEDITPLEGLTRIGEWDVWKGGELRAHIELHLGLSENWISDIGPLVRNSGVGKGDGLDLRGNPLSDEARDVHIPALQKRGANILFNPRPSGEIVAFRDKNLEEAVRRSLVVPERLRPVYESDLPALDSLRGVDPISDLRGIERCTSLEDVALWNMQIKDISLFAALTKMRLLALPGNQISDISALGKLTGVYVLRLKRNQISDITPLGNLVQLEILYLDENRIEDISALAKLTMIGKRRRWTGWVEEREGNEVHVGLSNNRISDVSPLAQNPGIGEGVGIDMRGNPLSEESIKKLIPQLEQRGVNVLYDKPKGGLEE